MHPDGLRYFYCSHRVRHVHLSLFENGTDVFRQNIITYADPSLPSNHALVETSYRTLSSLLPTNSLPSSCEIVIDIREEEDIPRCSVYLADWESRAISARHISVGNQNPNLTTKIWKVPSTDSESTISPHSPLF